MQSRLSISRKSSENPEQKWKIKIVKRNEPYD